MITKQSKTYALEFFGKAIILLSSQDEITWQEVGLADMGDPDFREMMKDFHAVVSAHGLRKAKVALFLPLEDIVLRRIKGDNPAQILAADADATVEDISFAHSSPDETGQYTAIYAYRETLQEAAAFVGQFGFNTTYFSARITNKGFASQPKIYIEHRKSKLMPMLIWPSLAAAAVVAVSAISILYSTSSVGVNKSPKLQFAAAQAPKTDTQAAPAKVILASAIPVAATPIVVDVFDVNDFGISEEKLKVQDKLSVLAVSEAVFTTQQVINTTYDGDFALPELNQLIAKPIVLNILSASVQTPILEALADGITTPTKPVRNLTDAAVPEDANYPRPTHRGTAPIVEPVVTPTTLPLVTDVQIATTRPPRRPAGLRNSASTTQIAIAQDLVQQAIKEDAVAANALTSASARAKGTNLRPPLKTSNFRSIVKRAAAKPTTTTVTTTTKTVAVSKPTATKPTKKDKTTRASTTFSKGALSLVGVFGAPSKRSALFRTSTGGYRSVKIGQRVAGWKVVSISESTAKVTKGSRTKTMRIP
jgi:hypothetical protein